MPLMRYIIKDRHIKRNSEVQGSELKDDTEDTFQSVAMAGLVNIVFQLGDLAEFSAEIFGSLHKELMAIAARGCEVANRVQNLETELPSIERAILSETNQLRFAFTTGSKWHARTFSCQNQLIQADMPKLLLESYEKCKPPPQLFMLDKFEAAGAGACLRRYSDPSFFTMQLANSEYKTRECNKKKKEGRQQKMAKACEFQQDEKVNVSVQHSCLTPDIVKFSIHNGNGSIKIMHGKEVEHIADGFQKVLMNGAKHKPPYQLQIAKSHAEEQSRSVTTTDDHAEVITRSSGNCVFAMEHSETVSKQVRETNSSRRACSLDAISKSNHFVDAMISIDKTEMDSERSRRPGSKSDHISGCMNVKKPSFKKSFWQMPVTKNLKQDGLSQKQNGKPYLDDSRQSNLKSSIDSFIEASAAKDGGVRNAEVSILMPLLSESNSSAVVQNECKTSSSAAVPSGSSDLLSLSASSVEGNYAVQMDSLSSWMQDASSGDDIAKFSVESDSVTNENSLESFRLPDSCIMDPITYNFFPNLSTINSYTGDKSSVSSLSSLESLAHSPVFSAFLSPLSPVKTSQDMLLLPELQFISFPTVLCSPSSSTSQYISSPSLIEEMPPPPPLPPMRWRVPRQQKKSLGVFTQTVDQQASPQLQTVDQIPALLAKHEVNEDSGCSQISKFDQMKKEEEKPSIQTSPKESSSHFIRSISGYDKGRLKKITAVGRSPKVIPLDDRKSMFEQIRTRSFTLRQTSFQKTETPQQAIKGSSVAAILDKANAIRQAFAGSEDDEDDAEWSDSS